MPNSPQMSCWQVLATKKKLLISCVLGLFFLAIGTDLRAELRAGQNQKISKRNTTSNTNIWQPTAGVKWQIQLINAVSDTTVNADIWDIDLFDNTADTITTLKSKGHKVICYFSAGTYEDWRPDISKFDTADLGNNLDEWPGERWLNIKSDKVRAIMTSRLDMAKAKGCDGVDPDNIDAYGNSNGLGLTEGDSIDFLKFLARESHSRGMAIGLKNGGDIIGSVIEIMQWSVNEQCAEFKECGVYAAFTEVDKPVFHIEYSKEIIEVEGSGGSGTDIEDIDTGSVATSVDVDVTKIDSSADTGIDTNVDNEDKDDEADEEDDKEDEYDATAAVTRRKPHRYGHGHQKLRARAVLSSTLKTSACNAANADKFSTVIKNMNLDAWVEYC
ncbi:uncharacterized protein PGRI_019330 [Penicillium griseofulvum]|uniref:alpha-galactosidase n=1 Tax=Penicillium patulum TaxID=5078 RepID=A0A135LGJ5_PENPA|nr:uncharacterized protein PGRI_019330 [Penicillium griseofulvum]KXG48063.1 hypothetical protein PGRI_019330 [Penicillium griseofulvum]